MLGAVLGGQGAVLGAGAAAAAADADGEGADAEVAAHLQHHARAVVEVGERHHRCGENYTCNNFSMDKGHFSKSRESKRREMIDLHLVIQLLASSKCHIHCHH